MTLGQPSLSSYYRYPICVSNAILLPLAAGLIGLWVWRLRARPAMPPAAATSARRTWGRAALYLTLFAAQCLMARCLWFYFAFVPSSVRQGAAALAASQSLPEEITAYFRQCPNNAPLTVLLSLPYRLGMLLGLAERAIAMTLHISLSVVVFRAVRQRKAGYLGLAVVLHALFDVPAALFQCGVLHSTWLVEALLLVLCLGCAAYAKKQYCALQEPEQQTLSDKEES